MVEGRSVEGVCSRVECREKQERFDKEDEGSNGYLELFRNEVVVLVVCEFVGLSPREDDEKGEVEGSLFWLVLVNAWVATAVGCLTERGIYGDQRQKLYADTLGKMLKPAIVQLTGNVQLFVQY